MVTLDGLPLSSHLVIDGLETAPPIAYQQTRVLGGASAVRAVGLAGGRALTLRADLGFITLNQIEAIRAMAAACQPVRLVHHRGEFDVLVTGIEATPALDYANPDPTTLYSASITTIEV